MADSSYKLAYQREKEAREVAERLLEKKTRELYQRCEELEKANERLSSTKKKLIQSDKMSSLGELAAGVAHEINNPLSYSLCNLELLSEYFSKLMELDQSLLEKYKDSDVLNSYLALRTDFDVDYITKDGEELLTSTFDGLRRIKKIISTLKNVTHQNTLSDADCDINDSIKNSLKIVWSELRYNVKVETHLSKVPLVSFDNGEIHQVLMNLFLNAKHACSKNGRITISTSMEEMDQKKWVKLEIADNGTGIPPEIIDRIFEPFYTTKPVGEGTGLGLSISLSIIENYGGKIKVSSEIDVGTVFTIYLKPLVKIKKVL